MRRRAVFERIQQKAETPPGFLVAETQSIKDNVLNIAAMDTNRTRSEFDAVQHEIVGLGPATRRVSSEFLDVFVMHGCERMMGGIPPLLLFVPFEHRKVDHPQE